MGNEYPTTHVGDRLREERVRIGLSQEDAALLCGLTRAMWGRYERSISLPNAAVLVSLIGHGFDVNFILGGSRTLSASTMAEDEEALLDAYRATDDEGRAAISRAAQMERLRATPAAQEKPNPYAVRHHPGTSLSVHDNPAPKPKRTPR